jgi:hypothetical protein
MTMRLFQFSGMHDGKPARGTIEAENKSPETVASAIYRQLSGKDLKSQKEWQVSFGYFCVMSPKGSDHTRVDFWHKRESTAVWTFADSGDAYDSCQCREDIEDGQTLDCGDGVVGLAWTWPIAVTADRGKLHSPNGRDVRPLLRDAGISAEQVRAAVQLAERKGLAVSEPFRLWKRLQEIAARFKESPIVRMSPAPAELLIRSYRCVRQQGYPAAAAFANARAVEESGRYAQYPDHASPTAPGQPFQIGGYACRWIEEPAPMLRAVDLGSARHRITAFRATESDEEFRPAVWQLPARNGQPLYVYGHLDPNNDGPAVVCFEATDCLITARQSAEDIAQSAADAADRDARMFNLGQQFADCRETAKTYRAELLPQLAEVNRAKRAGNPIARPGSALCKAFRSHVKAQLAAIRTAQRLAAELLAEHGADESFRSGADLG